MNYLNREPIHSVPAGPHDRVLRALGLATLFALAAALAAIRLADPDTWWMLAEGRLFLSGGFPSENVFSHAFPEHPWQHSQWLMSALLAGIEKIFGVGAVMWAPFLAMPLLLAICLDTIRRLPGRVDWKWSVPLLILALVAIRFRFTPRGHVATYLGLALLVNLRLRGDRSFWPVYALLGAVWANLHSGVTFGAVYLVAAGIGAVLEGDRVRARHDRLRVLAFVAGSLVNPYFAAPYIYLVKVAVIISDYPFEVGEMRPPPFSVHSAYYLCAALTVGWLLLAVKRREFSRVLPAVLFLALSARSLRIIPHLVIVALPWVLLEIRRMAAAAARRQSSLPVAGSILIWCLVVASALYDAQKWDRFRTPGFGVDWPLLPTGACHFVEDQQLTGRLFNDYGAGGFLAWRLYPQRQIFIDGRVPAYPRTFFEEYFRGTREAFSKLLEKYAIDYAIINKSRMAGRKDRAGAFLTLGWPLVFQDGVSYVFVRPDSDNATETADFGFRYLLPGVSVDQILDAAEQRSGAVRGELQRLDPARLLDLSWVHTLALAAHYAHDAERAVVFFERALEIDPDANHVRLDFAQTLLAVRRGDLARLQLEKVVHASPGSPLAAEAAQELQRISGKPGF